MEVSTSLFSHFSVEYAILYFPRCMNVALMTAISGWLYYNLTCFWGLLWHLRFWICVSALGSWVGPPWKCTICHCHCFRYFSLHGPPFLGGLFSMSDACIWTLQDLIRCWLLKLFYLCGGVWLYELFGEKELFEGF